MAKPLWTPPQVEHVREPCSWRRASIHIKSEDVSNHGEYALKFGFAKLAGAKGSIAIDNLSLSPDCFGIPIRSNCTLGSMLTNSRHISGIIRQQCICPNGKTIEPNSSITCQDGRYIYYLQLHTELFRTCIFPQDSWPEFWYYSRIIRRWILLYIFCFSILLLS